MPSSRKIISQTEYEALDLDELNPSSADRFRLIRRNNLHIGDQVKIAYTQEDKIIGMTDDGFVILENHIGYFHPISIVKS